MRDVPQKLVDMVVAQVPTQVYLLHLEWEPAEGSVEGKPIILGVFDTAQHAIETGRNIMDQKFKVANCTERVVVERDKISVTDDDELCECIEWYDKEGKVTGWSIRADHSEQVFRLTIEEHNISKASGSYDEVSFPTEGDMHHSTKCRCFDQEDDESFTEMDEEEDVGEDEDGDAEEGEEGEDWTEDEDEMEDEGPEGEETEVPNMEE